MPGFSLKYCAIVRLDLRGGDPRLGAPDDPRSDAARLLVPVQDLGDAPVRDPQRARDDARADSGGGHLDYLQTLVVGERAAVDENAAQLVHPTLTCRSRDGNG